MEIENKVKIVQLEERVKYLENRMEDFEQKNRELEGALKIYQVSATTLKEKLDLIYKALTGDELGNNGLMKRTSTIEGWVSAMERRKFWLLGVLAGAFTIGRLAGTAIEELYKIVKHMP